MCGITGMVHMEQDLRKQETLLRKMQATLNRRGPDQEGIFLEEHCALAHTRLAVIDVEHGRQPIIAGTLYHYRDPELLQLLLYLRIVMDHGGFNGKVTALVQDQLVIRSTVLAGIDHLFLFHGVLCFLDIPSILLSS